jgi:hypothetical protein
MFINERCKECKEFFTPKTIKNDRCKCMRKEDKIFKTFKKESKTDRNYRMMNSRIQNELRYKWNLKVNNRENRVIK